MAPGESTVVELIFKTRTYKTKISKYATIYSNDPGKSTAKIHLSANVYPSTDTTLPFSLLPEKVSLSQDSKKSKIVLENKGESKIRIASAGDLLDGLKLKIKNDDPKPGQRSELKFEWKDDFQKENVERSITFLAYGENGDSTRFSIPVVLQGTDPAPAPKVTTPRRTTARKTVGSKSRTVRKPQRRATTKTVDPRVIKYDEATDTKNQPTSADEKTDEDKTAKESPDDSSDRGNVKSQDNQ